MDRKLYRSKKNRILFGVCGGLAEYFNIDPVIVRVIAILLLVPGVFPAIIIYFILALVIPLEGSTAGTPQDSLKENISEFRDTAAGLGEDVRNTFENTPSGRSSSSSSTGSNRALYILGVLIIALGVFLILVNFFNFWGYAWPVLLVIAGVAVIALVARKKR